MECNGIMESRPCDSNQTSNQIQIKENVLS